MLAGGGGRCYNNWPRTVGEGWQGSQRRIKRCERERLREEKVQSMIRKLKNL